MKVELIIALDCQNTAQIEHVLSTLPPSISWFKVGLELFVAAGKEAIKILLEKNKNIFLDLKLHDIPNTVASAVKSSLQYKPQLITIHASGGIEMIKAAKQAVINSGLNYPKIIAVTTLTSLNEQDLKIQGITRSLQNHVVEMAKIAIQAGADGIVCSPLETAIIRKEVGRKPIIITPGIRFAENDTHDQKRAASPQTAIKDGANFLVVGRPILQAKDPYATALKILSEINNASTL